MEAVETTAENFVIYQNEINIRNMSPLEYKRGFALDICKELENMPFKQFAYQFHNIYQTHARDVNTKSFNPLFDESFEARGELDGPAVEMVRGMRELFAGEDCKFCTFYDCGFAYADGANWLQGKICSSLPMTKLF